MTDTMTRSPRQSVDAEDPRMVRRRRDVHAQARRRRVLTVATVVGVALLLVAGVAIVRSPLLDVDRIEVRGSESLDQDELIAASGIDRGDALIDLDRAGVRRRLMATPGVSSARVGVRWPDTVRIEVTEDAPFAVVSASSGAVVVARGGRVLGPADDGRDDLVRLDLDGWQMHDLEPGTTVEPRLQDGLVVLEQMPETLLDELRTALIAADGSLTFPLDDEGSVRFGPPEDVPAKLLAMATALGGRIERDCLAVLDVLEPSRPTISRRPDCRLAPPTVGGPAPGATSRTPSTTVARSGR